MFIDEVKVTFKAWKWWDWAVSWRREKYIPKWWPFGWNWWKWWDIVLVANPNENTLSEFRHKKEIKARCWESWWTQELAWANAEDIFINVPVWTLIKNIWWELIKDLSIPWESYILCRWWRWWFWNSHFASSTRQAPGFAELWDVWEEKTVQLELKLVADIWIIWLPNAWKSTLIKAITNVKPKIADYAFTTIIPNLWVLDHKWSSLVLEDVPWLIEWASEGKWLWHNFLKHIERTKVLLHLIDLNSMDEIIHNYETIRNELKTYKDELWNKEEIIVLSKADLFDEEMIEYIKKEVQKNIKSPNPIFVISAPSMKWIEDLKDFLIEKYANKDKTVNEAIEDKTSEIEETKIYDLKEEQSLNSYKIIDIWNMMFEVKWERIEQIARMTNMQNLEAVMRVFDVLKKIWALKKIEHLLNVKYKKETEMRYFEGDDKEDIIPKAYISWKCFPLDKVIFD